MSAAFRAELQLGFYIVIIRQVEHLRQILANFEAAMVAQQVSLSLITDFENKSEFKPDAHHDNEVQGMVAAMVARTDALAPLR